MCATPMLVMIATSGCASCARRSDFARMIHPDFPDPDFILGSRLENCTRQANVIIEIAFRLCDPETPGQNRGREILRACLAIATGDRDDLQTQRAAVVGGDLLIGQQRVRHAQKREIGRSLAAPFRLHDRTNGTVHEGIVDELVAVKVLSRQRDEQVAGPGRARVRTEMIDRHFSPAVLSLGSGKLRDLVDWKRVHD